MYRALLRNRDDIKHRWKEYFQTLLNNNSTVNDDIFQILPKKATEYHLDALLSEEEVFSAIKNSKFNMAAGLDGAYQMKYINWVAKN